MAKLFDIVLPAQIGQVVGIALLSGSPIVGPFPDCEIFSGPPSTFSSAKESVSDLLCLLSLVPIAYGE